MSLKRLIRLKTGKLIFGRRGMPKGVNLRSHVPKKGYSLQAIGRVGKMKGAKRLRLAMEIQSCGLAGMDTFQIQRIAIV